MNRRLSALPACLAAPLSAAALSAQTPEGIGSWEVVPSPNAGPYVTGNVLLDVVALSPTDAWAVGTQPNQSEFLYLPLAMHWDGTEWSIVSTPALPYVGMFGFAGTSRLNAVSAVTGTDVWAAGYWDDPACICGRTVIEHWDGASWSLVPSPNPGIGNYLHDIAAASAHDIWAVGDQWLSYSTKVPLILRYDGESWTAVGYPPVSYGELASVCALAADDAWAVGASGVTSTGIEPLALHWDGASWTRVPVPPEPFAYPGSYVVFRGVSGVASDDVWAVGNYKYLNLWGHYLSSARAYHWDGSTWTKVLYPGIAGQDSRMYGVHAVASDDVWAVGGGDPPIGSPLAFQYQTVHWDGVSWSDVENPRQGVLLAVSASSSSDAWAVGWGMDALAYSTGTHTLRYNAEGGCYPDCNTDGVLNVADFGCFQSKFVAGDPYADCTQTGGLTVADFGCFQSAFVGGCP